MSIVDVHVSIADIDSPPSCRLIISVRLPKLRNQSGFCLNHSVCHQFDRLSSLRKKLPNAETKPGQFSNTFRDRTRFARSPEKFSLRSVMFVESDATECSRIPNCRSSNLRSGFRGHKTASTRTSSDRRAPPSPGLSANSAQLAHYVYVTPHELVSSHNSIRENRAPTDVACAALPSKIDESCSFDPPSG